MWTYHGKPFTHFLTNGADMDAVELHFILLDGIMVPISQLIFVTGYAGVIEEGHPGKN